MTKGLSLSLSCFFKKDGLFSPPFHLHGQLFHEEEKGQKIPTYIGYNLLNKPNKTRNKLLHRHTEGRKERETLRLHFITQ